MVAILVDGTKDRRDRVEAARVLAMSDSPSCWTVLQEVAERSDEHAGVLRAAGQSLAIALLRAGKLLEAPLANLTPEAYLAFDDYVAARQNEQ
jgi:hypothetical protein